jgi:hypothetical protein
MMWSKVAWVVLLCCICVALAGSNSNDSGIGVQYVVGLYDAHAMSPKRLLELHPNLPTVTVTAKGGRKFLCVLPTLSEIESDSSDGEVKAGAVDVVQDPIQDAKDEIGTVVEELKQTNDVVSEASGEIPPEGEIVVQKVEKTPEEKFQSFWSKVAKHLKKHLDAPCYLKTEGYWTYEVCPFDAVNQFHFEGGERSPLFNLGHYDPEGSRALSYSLSKRRWYSPKEEEAMRPFVYVQRFTGGSGGRLTTVQFRCLPDEFAGKKKIKSTKAEFKSVKEEEPLEYDVIVRTSLVCKESLDRLAGISKPANALSPSVTSSSDPLFQALLLLQAFEKQCIFHHSGWWSYKICYMENLIQYHAEQQQKKLTDAEVKSGAKPQFETVTTVEYSLGAWQLPQHWTEYEVTDTALTSVFHLHNDSSPEDSYLSLKYSGGTKCDLTGQARSTELRLKCNEESNTPRVLSIQETATCQYITVMETNLLCSHPAFKIQHPETLQIRCAPLDADEEEESSDAEETIKELDSTEEIPSTPEADQEKDEL